MPKEAPYRYGSHDWRGKLPNRVSSDEKPAIADQRKRIGDWEVDTIIKQVGGNYITDFQFCAKVG